MPPRSIAVVGEHLLLAESIADLLRASGLPAYTITALEAAETLGSSADVRSPPVIVVASVGLRSETARRWARGEFPGSPMVVVGSRDPQITGRPGLRRVALPLRPTELVDLVRAATLRD